MRDHDTTRGDNAATESGTTESTRRDDYAPLVEAIKRETGLDSAVQPNYGGGTVLVTSVDPPGTGDERSYLTWVEFRADGTLRGIAAAAEGPLYEFIFDAPPEAPTTCEDWAAALRDHLEDQGR